jgi:hypothetical protein
MKRCALALLGLLALPLTAAAQDRPLPGAEPPPQRLPVAGISIMPYLGVRAPYTTGDAVLTDQTGDQFRAATQRAGGLMGGVDVMARVAGPVSFVAGASYSGSGTDVLRVLDVQTDTFVDLSLDGPRYWMVKAGAALRLADPNPDDRRFHPSAFITVAPALVWVDWADLPGFPDDANGSSRNFALNLGADAAARIGRASNWSFAVGVQDFLTFWNEDSLRARDATLGTVLVGSPVTVDYAYNTSNILTLRLGVAYRFR